MKQQKTILLFFALIVVGTMIYYFVKNKNNGATGSDTAPKPKPQPGGGSGTKIPGPENNQGIKDITPDINVGDTVVCLFPFTPRPVQENGSGGWMAAFGVQPQSYNAGDIVGIVIAIEDNGGANEDYAIVAPTDAVSTSTFSISNPFGGLQYDKLYECPFDNIKPA